MSTIRNIITICLILSFSAAARADDLLALVNGDSITVRDMEAQLERIHSGQTGAQHRGDFSVERLLQTLINNRLIVQEARSIGLDQDDAVAARVRSHRETIAYRALLSEVMPDDIPLSKGELADGFQRFFQGYRLRLICVNDSMLCAALRDSVRAGTEMADLAMRHSVDKYRESGGYAGVYMPVQMPVDLQNILAESSVGDLIGPILLWRVWTIVRLEEKIEADPALYDTALAELKNVLTGERKEKIRKHFVDSLRTHIALMIDSAAVDSVIIQMKAGEQASNKPVVIVGDNRILTASDLRNKYVHRIAGRTDRIADAVLYEVLGEQVDIMLMKEVASQSNFLAQPRFDKPVELYEDSLLLTAYLEEVIAPTVKVEEDEIKAYYEANRSRFQKSGRVKVATITRDSLSEAEADYASVSSGAEFSWVAKQHSTDAAAARGGTQDWMELEQFSPDLQAEFRSASIGSVLPPVATDMGNIVFKLLDREPGKPMPYEDARASIISVLESQEQFAAIDRAIQELRSASDIRVFQETVDALNVSGPVDQE